MNGHRTGMPQCVVCSLGSGFITSDHTSSALSLKVCSAYIASILRDLAGEAREIRAAGGFAVQAMQQMMTDVFACDVLIPEVYEASSFGAAGSQCLHLVPSTIWLMCTTDPHHGSARTGCSTLSNL